MNNAYLEETFFLSNLAKYIYHKVKEYRLCIIFLFINVDFPDLLTKGKSEKVSQ